ncbi:MAG: aminotransferase class V-fold PLP-dependent enzyme [Bacillota bacterium]
MTQIYLDNAATTNPKAPGVVEAVSRSLTEWNGNPGHGGHRLSVQAARVVEEARLAAASLLGISDDSRLAFTLNATDSLNLVLQSFLRPGARVITSSFEHNAVWRPLHQLRSQGVQFYAVPPGRAGWRREPFDLTAYRSALAAGASLVALTHASNVTGQMLPLADIVAEAHRLGVPVLVDASQTAGHLPLDVDGLGIDFLACSAHKGLLGPQGVGLLYVRPGLDLAPLRLGGTGGNSESPEPPDEMPERLEAGTLNGPGIAGLGAAAGWLLEQGLDTVEVRQWALAEDLRLGLEDVPGLSLYVGEGVRLPVASLRLEGWSPAALEAALDEEFGCLTRAGLHCAPQAHRTIGTFPTGTLRVSLGVFSTSADIAALVQALRSLSASGVRRGA